MHGIFESIIIHGNFSIDVKRPTNLFMTGSSGQPNCHFMSQDQITAYIKASDFLDEDTASGKLDTQN